MTSPGTADGLKVVFIGMNHEFSLAPFRALTERWNVVGAIESIHPHWDYRHGSWLKRIARRRSIPYGSMDRKNRPVELLRRTGPDLICIAGMAQRLRKEEWELARLGAINLHPSLLPNYRGPEPFFWQAQRMDLEGGVSIIQIDEGFDTGDILWQNRFPIALGASSDQILATTTDTGIEGLMHCLERLSAGHLKGQPQRHLPCPYDARPMRREDWEIDWASWAIERVWHFLRAAPAPNPTVPMPTARRRWAIGELVRVPADHAPGSIGTDPAGPFLAHPQGKIRLQGVEGPTLTQRIVNRLRRHFASP